MGSLYRFIFILLSELPTFVNIDILQTKISRVRNAALVKTMLLKAIQINTYM